MAVTVSRRWPRARAWSTAVTSAGQNGLSCRSRARLGPERRGQVGGPGGGEGVLVVVDAGGDGGGEVAADPPPQRGGGVVVGQVGLRGRGAQEVVGVDAGAGDGGEPFGQDGGELVASHGGCDLVEQVAPLGQCGGAVTAQACLQLALVQGERLDRLLGPGGSAVAVGDAGRGPPHGDVGEQGRVGSGLSVPDPRRRSSGVGAVADLGGEVGDQVRSRRQVGAPGLVGEQGVGDRGQPRQRARPGGCGNGGGGVVGSSRRQSRTAARSPAVSSSRPAAAAVRQANGSPPWAASRVRWARRVGQAGSWVRSSTMRSAPASSAARACVAEVVFGGDVQGVGVPGGRVGQAGGGVGLVAQHGGGGDGGVVAGEDLLEEVGGGVGVQVLRSDDGVRVAVADDLDVDVVGQASAGEHRVQLLAGLGPGRQAVHGVDGDALARRGRWWRTRARPRLRRTRPGG